MPTEGLFALVGAFWLSMVCSLFVWIVRDSRARGHDRPTVLGLSAAFTPFGLPYYLYARVRGRLGERSAPLSRRERLVGTWAAASVSAFLLGAVLSPPDPFSQIRYTLGLLALTVPAGYVLVSRAATPTGA